MLKIIIKHQFTSDSYNADLYTVGVQQDDRFIPVCDFYRDDLAETLAENLKDMLKLLNIEVET